MSNLSHELRTPLTSLRLLADTLLTPAGRDPDVAQDLAGKMSVEVATLQQMTQEMLDLAAIESGQQVVRLVSVSLADIVAGAVARLGDLAERSGISLRVEMPGGMQVLADPEQAERAVQNVLHNALKFSPAWRRGQDHSNRRTFYGGESCYRSGILAPASRPPSWSGSSSASSEATGPVAHQALAWDWPSPAISCGAHGGQIWAENRTPPDRGAVFHLAFRAA